jgi:hypothetical protein
MNKGLIYSSHHKDPKEKNFGPFCLPIPQLLLPCTKKGQPFAPYPGPPKPIHVLLLGIVERVRR